MSQETINRIKEKTALPQLVEESLNLFKANITEENPFYSHTLRTSLILKRMGAGPKTISANLLHHLPIEKIVLKNINTETVSQVKQIIKKSDQLRRLFDLVKKNKPVPLKKWRKAFLDEQSENLRKMFLVIARDLRPIFLTLAGRLDELQNLMADYQDDEKKKRAMAALEILAPLAYGLGMGGIKGELEDAAFGYLYPKEHQWLIDNVKEEYAQREEYLKSILPAIKKILAEAKIEVIRLDSRAKHYFSLYQKLLRHNMDPETIYDLVALRIIVPDIESCYQALGALHKAFPPLPGRIKDYISQPKANGYQSLHTTVECQKGKIVEFQIKTPLMHQLAEYGAAAHLTYKENLPKKNKEQLAWLDQVRRWREETTNPREIASHLKSQLFKDRIFVFSPTNEVFDMPKGATPIDFAFAIHSQIGQHCQGVKINSQIGQLKQSLKNGDKVEILLSKQTTPNIDWLRIAKTSKALHKIRDFLEKNKGLSLKKREFKQTIQEKAQQGVEALRNIRNIIPLGKKQPTILIAGEKGIALRMAKCCKPSHHQPIEGFISQGEGVAVHLANCPNLAKLKEKNPQHIITATWSE